MPRILQTKDFTRVKNWPLHLVTYEANDENCWNTLRAKRGAIGLGNQQPSLRNKEGSTIIPRGSRGKRSEARRISKRDDDMIWSDGKLSAARKGGVELATSREHTQIFTWNVYNDVSNQGTTLVETSTIAESNFTIAQGTGTVTELGNSVPYTGFLDNLSKHPVQEIINKVLKNDAKKGLDGQAWFQFLSTPLRVVASGAATTGTSTISVTLTTNGTATLTNSVAFTNLHVKSIVDLMKERNIPRPANDNGRALFMGGLAA